MVFFDEAAQVDRTKVADCGFGLAGDFEDLGAQVRQQVAVIDGAQAEELEQLVAVVIDGVVEQRGVGFDEVGGLIVDQTNQATSRDGLRELLDVLVAQFFVDVGGEQATGELGVVRLFDDVGGRGADGQLVELDRGCTIVQAADRASGDAHGVDTSRDPRRIVGCASGQRLRSCHRACALAFLVLASLGPGCNSIIVISWPGPLNLAKNRTGYYSNDHTVSRTHHISVRESSVWLGLPRIAQAGQLCLSGDSTDPPMLQEKQTGTHRAHRPRHCTRTASQFIDGDTGPKLCQHQKCDCASRWQLQGKPLPDEIVPASQRCAENLDGVGTPMRVSPLAPSRGYTIGATTFELDELAIRTASTNIHRRPTTPARAGLLRHLNPTKTANENIKKFTQFHLSVAWERVGKDWQWSLFDTNEGFPRHSSTCDGSEFGGGLHRSTNKVRLALSGACDARTHLDPGFDVCSDVFAPMLLPPSSSTFTAMHIKVTSGHVRANRLQLDHMSDLDHKLTPAEPHRVVVLKLASKDGEISKRTSKDSGSTGLTTAPSFLIDDSAAPPYAACRQLLWRPTVPGRTMHPGAGLSRLAPVSGFKASGTIPSAGLNVFFDRNIGAHRQAGRSKSFARKSDAQKHSWSPSRAGHAPRATYVDPRGRAGLLQSLIRGDRPLSPSTSMVSTGARVSILEAASRPQARPLPRRPYQAAQGQQTVADSVVARSTRRPSPHRDPLPRCSAASCGPIATAGFDLVKPPVSPSNGSTSCAEKSTSDTTLSRTVLAADYTPKANSHPAVLAPTKTESSVRRFPIADSLVVEDGVHDGVDVGLRCLVGHVVDRVACQVVALVELLAGNATPDVGLLWRLEHFGAGEQASSGDAHVDERLVVGADRRTQNRRRGHP
ncbi:hypothetical protein GQR58_029674 [Nymphon striatum]|nr:hypothetical protein GQR58_029674 [Nymphon striatum]